MKYFFLFTIVLSASFSNAQDMIINLPLKKNKEFQWKGGENDYFSEVWQTRLVTNVSEPTMQFFPAKGNAEMAPAVIVAPGGGLYAHSIDSEGNEVAQWLTEKGIAVFVLKYRLVPYTGDASKAFEDPNENAEMKAKKMLPYAVDDAIAAISFAKGQAKRFKIDPDNIGLMGFSAGGAVIMGATQKANNFSMPNFIVPVYPWMTIVDDFSVPENAPPMLVVCASDDPLDLAPMSVDLYTTWIESKKSAGLHMYSKGGHGFGMRKNNTATDSWIERCYEWMLDEGIAKK